MSKKKKDEYDYIYEQHDGSGFEFNYNKGRLGRSKTIFKDEADKIDPKRRNNDEIPLFVNCLSCRSYMDFEVGVNNLDGRWVCRSCRSKVREQTVYNQLNRDNDDYEKYYDDKDDDPDWL